MFSRTARKPRSERNCSGFFLCRGIIKRCTPLGSKCTPHRPFVKWYRGVKRKRLHGDNFRITVEPVIVKKYMKTLANRSFYKKKLDTNQDTHCIKIGVQLWSEWRDLNPRPHGPELSSLCPMLVLVSEKGGIAPFFRTPTVRYVRPCPSRNGSVNGSPLISVYEIPIERREFLRLIPEFLRKLRLNAC